MPLVSIILPVYNGASYVKEAVKSILQQSFTDFELVVIDDASTDATGQMLTSFSDSRLQIVKNKTNVGTYVSRNKGMKLSSGRYIAVMDADDYACPERLQLQFDYMESHPEILACGSQFYFMGTQVGIKKPLDYQSIQLALLKDNCFLHPSLFIRRETLMEIGGYREDYRYSLDYDLVCRLALNGKLVNLKDVLMKYRWHWGQISQAHAREQRYYAYLIRQRYQYAFAGKYTVPSFPLLSENLFLNPCLGESICLFHYGTVTKQNVYIDQANAVMYHWSSILQQSEGEKLKIIRHYSEAALLYLNKVTGNPDN